MDKNYDAIRIAFRTAMKEMFKQIPTTMTKPLIQRQKFQKLTTEIVCGLLMIKITKGLPTLRIPNPSKKPQEKEDEILKTI